MSGLVPRRTRPTSATNLRRAVTVDSSCVAAPGPLSRPSSSSSLVGAKPVHEKLRLRRRATVESGTSPKVDRFTGLPPTPLMALRRGSKGFSRESSQPLSNHGSRSASKRASDAGIGISGVGAWSPPTLFLGEDSSRSGSGPASARSGIGGSRASPSTASFPFPTPLSAFEPDGESALEDTPTPVSTSVLARKYRLELHEVKSIREHVEGARANGVGGLDVPVFHEVLRSVFDVPQVDENILKAAHKASHDVDGQMDLNKFLSWYVQNMFSHVASLRAAPDKSSSDSLVYYLAKKHAVSTIAIDRIKQEFDKWDADRSGEIDQDEFRAMLHAVLKCRNSGDLSESRVQRFWKEIDVDGNGMVDFGEFVVWYLKYFNPDGNVDGFNYGPVEVGRGAAATKSWKSSMFWASSLCRTSRSWSTTEALERKSRRRWVSR
eukprot:TRINITY_DN16656_c0_g2_i3.p1 TRINITY_DN16656_c0_g2~~TRINITY_DN16656_c0_g2_i3.p1  ORF type:complete len:435 (+),score=73.83 TRINITY_DN16656_c0_g2_i3:81-1385(+)